MTGDNRSLEDIHRDIEFGNRYRLEYIRTLVSITAGIFVISVAFMSDVIPSKNVQLKITLILSWAFLTISMVSGVLHFKLWSKFYITYRKPFDDPDAIADRKRINRLRKKVELLQTILFCVGVALMFFFAAVNI